MSTKIYDAYKLTNNYDLISLNAALSDLRKHVTKQCEDLIANIVVHKFLKLYYMTLLYGPNYAANTDTDTVTATVLDKIAQHDMKAAWGYHYQNQCDKPDDISDEEWNKRESDWNTAIGPDYIPANHGLQVQLFNPETVLPIFNPNRIENIIFPTDEKMIKILAKTVHSQLPKEEIEKAIKAKITFIHTKEDFRNI